jgi:hypothetical protein
VKCDISRAEDIEHLVFKIRSMKWNVAGVIQCTTVLKVRFIYYIQLLRLAS